MGKSKAGRPKKENTENTVILNMHIDSKLKDDFGILARKRGFNTTAGYLRFLMVQEVEKDRLINIG